MFPTGKSSFARSSLCVVGSVPISLRVVGLRFARDNERLLIAWGTDEAHVYCMNESLTTVVREASLAVGLSPDGGTGVIVNSHWLHGSGTCVIVGCNHCFRIFDATKLERDASPVVEISISFARLIDFAVVRCENAGASNKTWAKKYTWKIFALLSNGHLYEAIVSRDDDGKIFIEKTFDPDQSKPVHTREACSSSKENTSSKGSCERGHVTYLQQSSLLVYQM